MKGLDPYDALAGTRIPTFVRSRARTRQAAIQVRKRLPVNLAPLLGIEPRVIAKAIGCFLTAEARLAAAERASPGAHRDAARKFVALLDAAEGNCGDGAWGYEFDVQTRWAHYLASSPNLIATFFVGRGLAAAGACFGDAAMIERARQSAGFLAEPLFRRTKEGRPFFAYTLDNPRLVHNANLLGAGFVAAMGATCSSAGWVELAVGAAATTIAAQRPDGSWPYGEGSGLSWSDNFHTAYNIDGLLLVWLASGDDRVRASLERGVAHWTRDFFGPVGEPKYYPGKPFPYDIHSAATAVDVAARLATWGFPTADLARRVAEWTRVNLLDPRTGRTYFQKHRFYVDKRHFIRWGEAHWALGKSSLALLDAGTHSPFEGAVRAAARQYSTDPSGSRDDV